MKYLSNDHVCFKKCLSTIEENAIVQVAFLVEFIETSVVLPSLRTLNIVRAFEKALIGVFSCINTRLAFDTGVLLNDNNEEKVLFDLDTDGKKQTRRISYKILKMDENNQYGMAMTKPLPYHCI